MRPVESIVFRIMRRQAEGRQELEADIAYAIAALKPSPTEIIRTFENATGVTVDPEPSNLIPALDGSQLQAVWKLLSESSGWTHVQGSAASDGR